MKKEEEKSEEEIIEIVDKTMKKAEKFVDHVIVRPKMTGPGKCDECHRETDKLIKLTSYIYYKAEDGLVEDEWYNLYCISCFQKMVHSEVKLDGYDNNSSFYR